MALTNQTSSMTSIANVNGTLAVAGTTSGLGGNTISQTVQPLGTAAANAAVGGADEAFQTLLSIAASGNATINLQSFTDIAGQATTSLTRVKGFRIQLLSTTQTAPDGTAGTACSSITCGAAGSNPWVGPLGGTSPTYTVNNGSVWHHQDGSANGIAVSGTDENLKIVNNDSGNGAKVLVTFIGGST